MSETVHTRDRQPSCSPINIGRSSLCKPGLLKLAWIAGLPEHVWFQGALEMSRWVVLPVTPNLVQIPSRSNYVGFCRWTGHSESATPIHQNRRPSALGIVG
jgi:hypothetical protein